MLVFREKYRTLKLPDVMIQCSGAHKLCVGADGPRCLRSKSGHLHRMLECAGCLLGKTAKQPVVDVAKLYKSYGGGEAKQLLNNKDEHLGKGEDRGIDGEICDQPP